MSSSTDDIIKTGDHVIVQRQSYTKLYRLKGKCNVKLGVLTVELDNVVGQRYFDSFQMKPKGGSKKLYELERVTETEAASKVSVSTSGVDNRHITDDGLSQKLTRDEIEGMRDTANSTEILEKLVENSKTFEMKTEYAQEKYLKKKEKKYFDYVRIRRPSIRLMVQMFYRQDPQKILGIRGDDLSLLLSYSNVQNDGDYLLYDSGTSGLVTAAFLERIGANTSGRLIHMHPGNECQKNAVVAMQFPQEQLDRCINVNIYSVLRWFYQNMSNGAENVETDEVTQDKKRKHEESESDEPPKKKPAWHFDNDKVCKMLQSKVDAIIIVSKEHPVSLVKELSQFLKPSRSLVVFNSMREPLSELFSNIKESADYVNVQLVNNFMRSYQVLPDRTHPVVTMSQGGNILFANKITCAN